jgi:hypothetical protein
LVNYVPQGIEDEAFDENSPWSMERLVDELFLNLAGIREMLTTDEGKTISVRKYYSRARELMMWIPIARPPPEFVINASDLSHKVIEELEIRVDNPDAIGYILKQAAGRIFENLDFNRYHQSIARSLKVRLEP